MISLLGDWFNFIASAALITSLTETGAAVGGLFAVRMLAPFFASPIAGVVADRYNRKHILIITDLTRAITAFGFLLVRDASQIWLLYTLTLLQLGISGFFFPTRNAILPDLTSARELGAANALSSATWSVMLALGAALGGFVSGLWGIYPAFTIDGLTFLVSAVVIALIRYDEPPQDTSTENTLAAGLQAYFDGLRYLKRHLHIFIITLHKGINAVFSAGALPIIQVYIAENLFVIGEGGGISLGLMFSMAGFGTGIGPIITRHFTGDDNRRLALGLTLGYLISIIGLLLLLPLNNFSLVLFATLIRGAGGGIIWVFSTQLLIQLVSGEIRGRIFAFEFALFSILGAIGAGLAGGLLDTSLGLTGILWIAVGFTFLSGLLWQGWLRVGNRE